MNDGTKGGSTLPQPARDGDGQGDGDDDGQRGTTQTVDPSKAGMASKTQHHSGCSVGGEASSTSALWALGLMLAFVWRRRRVR